MDGAQLHTLVRAYLAAGCPQLDLAPLGSYGDWTRMVRAPLVWLGLPDPAGVIERTRADDPSREAIATVLTAWRAAFASEAATVADAVSRSEHDHDLRDALAMVALRRGQLDPASLGRWLRDHRDTR